MKRKHTFRSTKAPVILGGTIAVLTLTVLVSTFYSEMAHVAASLLSSFVDLEAIRP